MMKQRQKLVGHSRCINAIVSVFGCIHKLTNGNSVVFINKYLGVVTAVESLPDYLHCSTAPTPRVCVLLGVSV